MKATTMHDQVINLLLSFATPPEGEAPYTIEELPEHVQAEFARRADLVLAFFADQEELNLQKISEYGVPMVELTRRNLTALLEKLDDPNSQRTLIDGTNKIAVKAVEDSEHYTDRPAGTIYMPTSGRVK